MNDNLHERPQILARYFIEHDGTVRSTANVFGISKSTVHKDLTFRLKRIDLPLYREVSRILAKNKSERHLRGGIATRLKYAAEREKKHQ